ncbi:MAG TPA: hypothetical protein VFX58_09985, partial [Chitinophagaceae bacterium]|nr:hypothetical protein [Chitinophagaceae bacterium]
ISLFAQDITGIWKGYFISDGGQYYKLEFQIANNAGYATTGVSYSYLDVRFYGKATMTGNYLKGSKKLRIKEVRTVEVKSLLGGITCIMNYELYYSRSGNEEFLEGTYLGRNEHPLSVDTSYWGDCGGGKVSLRRVTTSDFYVEPFLRKKGSSSPVTKTPSTTPKTNPPATTKKTPAVTKPTTRQPVTTKPQAKPPIVKKPVTKPTDNTPVTRSSTDTSKKVLPPAIVKKAPDVPVATPNALKSRTNELVKSLVVHDENVTVKLYDNGEIDDDTISVYLDKKLVLSAKRLTAAPLIIKLKMDEDNSVHELVMVAENLGRIPPNTSLMIVESGEQRFDVRITSTEQKNAVVRFRYEKSK